MAWPCVTHTYTHAYTQIVYNFLPNSFNEHDLGHNRSASVSNIDETNEVEDSWQLRSETMSGEHKPLTNSQKHQTFNF